MASITTQGGYYKWSFTNGENTYTSDNIMSGTLTDGLYETFGVGNTVARQLNLTLWNVELDPSEPIVLTCREIDANGNGMDYAKGTYWIDTISTSPYSEFTEVVAFDAMLKSEVVYLKEGEFTAQDADEIVSAIASDMGIEVDIGTLEYMQANPIEINEAPSMGDNGTTDRQMLSVIGILYCGNWYINDDNELMLDLFSKFGGVVFENDSTGNFFTAPISILPFTTLNYIVVDAVDGSLVLKKRGTGAYDAQDTDDIVYVDTFGNFQVDTLGSVKNKFYSESIEIGNEVIEFDSSPYEYLERLELQKNGNVLFRYPSDMPEEEWESLGKCLAIDMPIMASQELADSLFEQLSAIEYVPYKANGLYISPWEMLGTAVHIKNDWVYLSNRTISLDQLGRCDSVANPTQELQSHYPYVSPVVRETRKGIAENTARIIINEGSIVSEVTRASEEEGKLNTYISTVEETANAFTIWHTVQPGESQSAATTEMNDKAQAVVNAYDESVQTYMRYENNTLELGETGSPFKAKLDNQKLAFTGESGEDAAWISNNELYVNHMVVPGGTSGRWIQQVNANNHFQIRWESN